MPKTESTAVNHLIDLVQSKPLSNGEPSDDLFGPPKAKTTTVSPPRMSATMPPMRGGGEVAPLPPGRTPSSTGRHDMPSMPPPVRMMTAPPSRPSTIPPLPRAASPSGLPLPRPSSTTRPPLPVPNRASQMPVGTPAPTLLHPPAPTRTQPPASTPVAAPFESRRNSAVDAHPFVAVPMPPQVPQQPIVAQAPPPRPPPPMTIDQTGDAVAADDWFEQSRAVDKIDETWMGSGTMPVTRQRDTIKLAKKLIVPTAALVLVGVLVGGYVAFDGEGGKTTHAAKTIPTKAKVVAQADPTPSPSAESPNAATATANAEQPEPPAPVAAPDPTPAPTAPPVAAAAVAAPAAVVAPTAVAPAAAAPAEDVTSVREVQTNRGVVKLVDVRIDSKPAGATVMLVDKGKTSFLGTTPVAASVDPSRAYDVIFTLEGRPTQIAHLDPNKAPRLDVNLGGTGARTAVAAVAKPAPVARPVAAPVVKPAAKPAVAAAATPAPSSRHARSKPTGNIADPFDAPAKPAKQVAAASPAAATGSGTLMVSSKPPCEIVIDGKHTGLSTPQRSIPLSAGPHKITFVNATDNVNKTVAVSISADHSTKLIEDLMNK